MSKMKVTGLELQTQKGQKVALTLEEAKELHQQLNELFGKKEVSYIPSYRPYYPYITWYGQSPAWAGGFSLSSNNNVATVSSNATGMQTKYLCAENSA